MRKPFIYIITIILLSISVDSYAQKKSPERNKKKEDKNVNYAFIPVLSYNRSFGMQFGAVGNAYFDMNRKDTISPASSVGFYGHIFTNKTFFTGLFSKFFFKEDHWRTKLAMGYGNINFQTFVEVPEGVPAVWATDQNGVFVDYKTQMAYAYGEITRLTINHLYLGVRLVYSYLNTDFDSPYIPSETLNLFGMGLASEYDLRDNVFNPHRGLNAKFQTFSFFEELGSTQTYHRINPIFNIYFPTSDKSTLVARFYGAIAVGDSIPFNGKNTVGRDDLRGYTDGKYRANQVYDVQAEYRWNFYKKWGMVAFGGIAIATDDLQGNNYSGILPAVGAGIRYMVIPKRKINIGLDVAVGQGDWGMYFRIGETFTR